MITIIGLGFVGLTTGLGFAKKGFKTFGIDINKERMDMLHNFVIPFHEPHLQEVLKETDSKTFFMNTSFEEAIRQSKYVFICVGTPGTEAGSADLTHMIAAIDQILAVDSTENKILIVKSTVPPSTLATQVKPYIKQQAKKLNRSVDLASNPEFLREGHCWEDFIEPDRIVIGVDNDSVKESMETIYKPFNAPIHFVTFNTAEFIKYLSNTLLSTLVSYANEMSMIASIIGDINIPDAFHILHQDKRWHGSPAAMSSYVYPGCGYGGYCLPKDTAALHNIAKNHGFDAKILKSNLDLNEDVKDFLVKKVTSTLPKETRLGILGLSFKPESDDVRLSATKDIIEKLIKSGWNNLVAYDPVANNAFKNEYPDIEIEYVDSVEEILEQVENVIILTAWGEFKEKASLIKQKNNFDFRYMLEDNCTKEFPARKRLTITNQGRDSQNQFNVLQ